MKKIINVVGARPQFVKAAMVARGLERDGLGRSILVHTGQHYDANMSQIFFDELGLPRPDFNLGIGSGLHGEQTGKMMAGIEQICLEVKPDWVLIHGDTNSTAAGAMAAVKLHIPVAHVEAGLRSFNRRMPEEINRIVADHISDALFAPTTTAVDNLRHEGIPAHKVHLVGDVMFDAALIFGERAKGHSTILSDLGLEGTPFMLATAHRAENTDDPARLAALFGGLAAMTRHLRVVLPLHPRTRAALARQGLLDEVLAGPIDILDPIGYLDMIRLEQACELVATDSGGVQKEAFFFGHPVVVLRDETEWVELVDLGWAHLAPPTTAEGVLAGLEAAWRGGGGRPGDPYGHGDAGAQVASVLLS